MNHTRLGMRSEPVVQRGRHLHAYSSKSDRWLTPKTRLTFVSLALYTLARIFSSSKFAIFVRSLGVSEIKFLQREHTVGTQTNYSHFHGRQFFVHFLCHSGSSVLPSEDAAFVQANAHVWSKTFLDSHKIVFRHFFSSRIPNSFFAIFFLSEFQTLFRNSFSFRIPDSFSQFFFFQNSRFFFCNFVSFRIPDSFSQTN